MRAGQGAWCQDHHWGGHHDLCLRGRGPGQAVRETTALDGVDLAARQGTVLGVLGPNGAGKTTAVRILATLLRPDAGTRGRRRATTSSRDAAEVRRLIGLTGQYASVDEDLTGTENLVLIGRLLDLRRREAKARAAELLGEFDLTEAADRPAKTYSGGMRRRLDLAASLVGRPGDHLPRRADHRPRPGQARGRVEHGPRAGRRGHHRAADHAVPRRGRRAGRRDLRHRPRQGHRARHRRPSSSTSSAARPIEVRPVDPAHLDTVPAILAAVVGRSPAESPGRGVLTVPVDDDEALDRRSCGRLDEAGIAVTELVAAAAEPRRGLLHPDRRHRQPKQEDAA